MERKPGEVAAWFFGGSQIDERPLPPDGEWLVDEGEFLELSLTTPRGSVHAVDALLYASGPTLCRVTLRRIVDKRPEWFVCHERRIDWRITDSDELLRAFTRRVALSMVDLWKAPPIVRQYLETGDDGLRRVNAWGNAWFTAWHADRADAAVHANVRDEAGIETAYEALKTARRAAWYASDAKDESALAAASGATAWALGLDGDSTRGAKYTELNDILERMLMEHHEVRRTHDG